MGISATCDICGEATSVTRQIRRNPGGDGWSVKIVIEESMNKDAPLSKLVICDQCVIKAIQEK